MTNLVATNNPIEFGNSQIELIKNTVAKGATTDELNMFMYLAQQYNLDPFKKEIWFMKYNGTTTMMTSRDGYLKYAQMNEDFEGLMSFVVREGDVFEVDASEYKVTHKFGAKRGPILGAWSRCDRKGKKPFIAYVEFAEYNKKTKIWENYPSAMIQKVAEVFVLKRAFGINGLVTKEEIDGGEVIDETPIVEIPEVEVLTISADEARHLFKIAKGNDILVKQAIEEKGFKATNEVTKELYKDICARIAVLLVFKEEEPEIEELPFEDIEDIEVEEQVELPWEES